MNVDEMQTKLATWAKDPSFKFDDVYNLLYDEDWIRRAYRSVKSNSGSRTAGVDGETMEDFKEDLGGNLRELRKSLKSESFDPMPVRRTYIPKGDGRKRPLGIPTIRDRIVQEALRMVLEPIYETDFSDYSFGFRQNRRTHDAIKATYMAMNERMKMFWVIDADIKGFFDNVNHQILEQTIQDRVTDRKVRDLIWDFLKSGIMEEGTFRHSKLGTPQGGIVSPVLANIYLNELDQWVKRWTEATDWEKEKRRKNGKGNWRYVRYADDFLFMTNGTREHAEDMRERLGSFVSEELDLTLSRKKTEITHVNDGFEFLGYRLERKKDGGGEKGIRWVIPEETKKDLKDDIVTATKGSHNISARNKIRALNALLRGWAEYYKYSTDAARVFSDLDHFVWDRVMGWLAEKYRSSVSKVIENQLERKDPITINGKSIVRLSERSSVYRESPTNKEHPYLTETKRDKEELPPEDPWLGNVEYREGWWDRRWEALERDEWTCQECGEDLKGNARVHHIRPFKAHETAEKANRLENLTSLCEECHKEIESNRKYQ